MNCRRCQRPIRPQTAPGAELRHQGRGLCGACHVAAGHDGTLYDYERVTRPSGEVVDEVQHMLGEDKRTVAARLGYKDHKNLYQALRRAGRTDLWFRLAREAA